jgi:hypothetical protein
MLTGMGDQHDRDNAVTGDHEHDQDPAVAAEAADLLDHLRGELDPPVHHDIAGQHADWRLRRAAELARERAAELDERPEGEADRRE